VRLFCCFLQYPFCSSLEEPSSNPVSVDDLQRKEIKLGNLQSAEVYVHIKPALGGTFTDIAIWVFVPSMGLPLLKLGFSIYLWVKLESMFVIGSTSLFG
jgi:hypothetical protein